MVFSSLPFLFLFLPIFLLFYYISPDKFKNFCLLAGSLFFYFYGVKDQPFYFGLLVLSILINYWLGILIGKRRLKKRRQKWLVIGILYNLFWLFLFKYSGFFAENINLLLTRAGSSMLLPVPQMILPVGISFYTFQALSYLIDVYRKTVTFEPSWVNFGMYLCMFPQLIAGPIVTYSSIKHQLSGRKHSLYRIEDGLQEFTIGLGLKVLLANQLGGLWHEVAAIGYESISTPLAWLGLVGFSLQIYFDFYGYSLMAKGLGKLMGFQLPDNFNYPYMALSMTEFWRKWHMTLSSWFRDYVYIPLGGNRNGKLLTFCNLFVVWFLTGFWHGASWNFILWGLVLFLLIFLEKLGLLRILERFPVIGHLYMIPAVLLTWMLFAVTDLSQIVIYTQRLFPFLAPDGRFSYFAGDFIKYGKLYALSLSAGLIFMTPLPRKIYQQRKYRFTTALALAAIFWLCVFRMKMGADDPFLYFRF